MTQAKKNKLIKKEILRHLDSLVIDDYTKNNILNNGKIIAIFTANKFMLSGVFKAHGKLFADISRKIDEIKHNAVQVQANLESAKKIDTIIALES